MQSSYTTLLQRIYEAPLATRTDSRLGMLLETYRGRIPVPAVTALSERDSILITYGDQVREPGRPNFRSLGDFCEAHLRGVVSSIHVLPFFPSSSDDGFSVMDHREVDPALGDWGDVERLGHSFRLMFDGVINHASAQGEWFRAFLRNERPFRDYFITIEGDPDLSRVTRPRLLPLITEVQTAAGPRRVWTTFSADQVDLEFHNPDVLLEILDILLMYAQRGAQFLRLDAVAYLWKEIGTPCISLPRTHFIVQLLRAVLDEVAPHVRLVTETNVPHAENIAYFGDGTNEAQLVYNFALPPLVMHTFRTGDASVLSEWASGLEAPSESTTFLNFLASHDGIGLNPVRGILSRLEIDALVEQTRAHGGLVSYKLEADGTYSPYELNINYFDALSDPAGGTPPSLEVDRFMAAQTIMLSLRGVPGVYFHSLFGSRNWAEGVSTLGNNRLINRQKLSRAQLEDELSDRHSLRSAVFERYRRQLAMRRGSAAFHPQGSQRVLDAGRGVFALLRGSPNGRQESLCLHNVTAERQSISLLGETWTLEPYQTLRRDLH